MKRKVETYGLMAEFDSADAVVVAAQRANDAGYTCMDAYSPFPVHGLAEAIGFHKTHLPLIVLGGGIFGMIAGFGMMVYSAVFHYPLNIGGRPFYSWPAFIPITFETTVLCAAGAAVFGMLALNGLPQPYHPVFNVPRFELASRTHFFLCIEATDPKFDPEATKAFLQQLTPLEVSVVAA